MGDFYIGVPTIYRNNFKDVSEYRGLIYARFLCTDKKLFLPVLPVRISVDDGSSKAATKLVRMRIARGPAVSIAFPFQVFCCCFKCAQIGNTNELCDHSENERSFESVVTTEEVAVAIARGYRILEIYEESI